MSVNIDSHFLFSLILPTLHQALQMTEKKDDHHSGDENERIMS